MHPCTEWRADVFRSINDFKNLSLMGKGRHDLTLIEVSAGTQFLFWGGKFDLIKWQ